MINLDSTIFNINVPSLAPRTGSLLVSEPFLREPYFNHSVIMLLEHNNDVTSMGLVLNRPTEYSLGDLVAEVPADVKVPVFCGGPVGGDRLFYMHTLGNTLGECSEVADGLWIGGDFETVIEYVRSGLPTEGVIRFFLGYSGWEAGQLEDELKHHVWTVANPEKAGDLLVGADDAYWHRIVRGLGPEFAGWKFHPMQPIAN